jgi:hypothetical protein
MITFVHFYIIIDFFRYFIYKVVRIGLVGGCEGSFDVDLRFLEIMKI